MPSPPTRSASTANASGTFGSGTCDQPRGTGSTMLSALKSRATCGSSLTPFALKNSSNVTEPAGSSVSGAAAAAGTESGGGQGLGGGRGGRDARLPVGLRDRPPHPGITVAVCVDGRGARLRR